MAAIRHLLRQLEFKKYNDEKRELDASWAALKKREAELRREDDASRIHLLNPDRICANPAQPRKSFDDGSITQLADSIRRFGMLQPIAVRRLSDEESPFGGLYELISGERRLRAAKMLSLEYVPSIIIEADSDESASLAIIENLQREDLNIFDEAAAIAALCENHGLRQEEAAALLCVSQSYIANKIRLLKLTAAEREMILKHDLTERHARLLLKIKTPEMRMRALATIIEKNMNVTQSEEYVKKLLSEDGSDPPRAKKTLVIKDIRILLNSIDRAVGMVKQAGIPVEQVRSDGEEMIEVTIKIPRAVHP